MSDKALQSIYRIIDASANRAGEGLRTMEEFARFVLNDPQSTQEWKSLRHALAAALSRLPRDELLSARDTGGDVGTEIAGPKEYHRANVADVVAAAASRTQQSLRVLEEYGKTIDPSMAKSIEQIRYRCYDLSSALEKNLCRQRRRQRIVQAKLYVLVDAGESEAKFVDEVTRMFAGDVDVIQLRDRSTDDRTLLGRARLAAGIARAHDKLFIMNDRPDIAATAGADGVHVGQEELPVAETRRIVGPDRLIGVSTHSIEQARAAIRDGADYIGCGPVFPGRTKEFESYAGTAFLEEVAGEIELPAFAIGGIDASNLGRVIEAGIDRIAVTGAVRDADDGPRAAAELRARLTRQALSRK